MPKVGMFIIDSVLGKCYIVAVHPAGTMDVQAANGKVYRLSGLTF